MSDRVIRIILTGDSRGAVQALQVAGAAAEKTTTKLDLMHKAGQNMTSAGRTMTQLAVPVVAVGVAAVKTANTFQQSMLRIRTQADQSQREVNKMSAAVLKLAPSVNTGPNALAEALYHVESSGYHGTKALNLLKVAAEGARVGNANLTDTTNAMTAAVVSGVKGVGNYKQAMGALNATVGAGNMTMQDLASALGTGILGPMKRYGVSVRDVGGALAVLGDNSVFGQEAATKLTSAIRIMAAPSQAASKWLGAIGLSQTRLANDLRSPGGIVKAFKDLKKHLEDAGLTASQQALVITRAFGGRQSTAVQLLLGQIPRLQNKVGAVSGGMGSFGGSWSAYQKTPQAQWQKFTATMQTALIKLGNAIMPIAIKYLPKLAHAAASVLGWFTKLPKPVKDFLFFFTMFLAIGGPILMFTGKVVSSIATIAKVFRDFDGPLSAFKGGLGGMSGVFGKLTFAALAAATALKLIPVAKKAVHNVSHNLQHLGSYGHNALASNLASSATGKGLSGSYTMSPFGGSGLAGNSGPHSGLGLAQQFWNAINPFSGHNGGIIPGFDTGGIIGGYGGGDKVPAFLERGEGILRKESVAAMGSQNFNAINANGSVAGRGTPSEVYVIAPIKVTAGGRVIAEETVHAVARRAALSGRMAVNA